MRGGSSDRASTAGEAGTVSKRRQESLEKHLMHEAAVIMAMTTTTT
jgi:hypothetical protein